MLPVCSILYYVEQALFYVYFLPIKIYVKMCYTGLCPKDPNHISIENLFVK